MSVTKIRWIYYAIRPRWKTDHIIKSKEEYLPCHEWSAISGKISESMASIPWVKAWWAAPQMLSDSVGTKLALNPQGTSCHVEKNPSYAEIPQGLHSNTNATTSLGSSEDLASRSQNCFNSKTVSFGLSHKSKKCLPWRPAASNAVSPLASPILCDTAKSPMGAMGTSKMLWSER